MGIGSCLGFSTTAAVVYSESNAVNATLLDEALDDSQISWLSMYYVFAFYPSQLNSAFSKS